MPKVLICASTLSHIRNFHLPYLKFFKEQGFEVHIAVPENAPVINADVVHPVPITKRLISLKNAGAALQLRKVIKANGFDLILTHTALAAFVARLAVLFNGKRTAKLINTVHGYFFWNGCGTLKKIVYYMPERLLRRVTDGIITMNDEDSLAARKLVNKGGLVVKVPGMGVDDARFTPASDEEKEAVRRAFGIPEDRFVLVYPAEFSKRKNHMELIRAMAVIVKNAPEAILLLCGTGALLKEIEAETDRLGLRGAVRFMGWRGDMETIYKACDMAVSTSISEGLPFNIAEAQLCALPVVASRIRGHTDLLEDGVTGWLYRPGDHKALAQTVLEIMHGDDRGKKQGLNARASAMRFSLREAYMANTEAYMRVYNS